MDSSFGTKLRLQREQHQVPLSAIAEKTKIKLSLLEGLERDDVSRWPKGIFRRSYVRAYASAIGLEPDRTLREFEGLFPDPDEAVDFTQALAHARHIEGDQGSRRPPMRLRYLIDSAVSALPALHLQSGRNGLHSEHALGLRAVEGPPAPAVLDEASVRHAPQQGVDLMDVADLCTKLARAVEVRDITPVLEEAARVLRAVGLIVWVRNCAGSELTPVFVHGYSSEVIAQLGRVSRGSDNAIALAFRAGEVRIVDGGDGTTGAVVVPIITSTGCAGVLALELRDGGERLECVRAAAIILAAQLSTLLAAPHLDEAITA